VARGRVPRIVSSEEEARELRLWAGGRKIERRLAQRAEVILAAAAGQTVAAAAGASGLSPQACAKWRCRFETQRLDGLRDRPRSGRPPTIAPSTRVAAIARATETPPGGPTRWTQRQLASEVGIGPASVNRVLGTGDPKPHETESGCGRSPVPRSPPGRRPSSASTWSRRAARRCSRSTRSRRFGRSTARSPSDRSGSPPPTSAPAPPVWWPRSASPPAPSKRAASSAPRTRSFSRSSSIVIVSIPAASSTPSSTISASTSTPPCWTGPSAGAGATLHFTPTYASWLDQIEIWFRILAKAVLKGGVWHSKAQLVAQIITWTYTGHPLAARSNNL
jgi:putative transposase